MFNRTQSPSFTDLYRLKTLIDLDQSKSWQDLCDRDILIGEECREKGDTEKLVYWTRKLAVTNEAPSSSWDEVYTTNIVGLVALIFGFFGMVTFLLASPDVNVRFFLYIFVLLQFLFSILSLFIIYRSVYGTAPAIFRANPMKIFLQKIFSEESLLRECPSVARLLALKYSQEAGVVFTIGAIVGLLICFDLFDPGFTWGAVFGDENYMRKLVDIVSSPWANFLPDYVVSGETIHISHRYDSSTSTSVLIHKEAQKWASFLIMSMVVYALFPRLILWALTLLAYRKTICEALVGFPGSDLILARMSPQNEIVSPVFCVVAAPQRYSGLIADRFAPLSSIYELIGTEGIPHASLILNHLEERKIGSSGRPAALAQCIKDHKQDLRFRADFRTLGPIIDGAGIIYFVDGNLPYTHDYEAEMEILCWTDRLCLAVIDANSTTDFVGKWSDILNRKFSRVLVFDNKTTDFRRQIEILAAMEELNPRWKGPLSQAIHILRKERYESHEKSGKVITDFVISAIQYHVTFDISKSESKRQRKDKLEAGYRAHVKSKEVETWRQIVGIYKRSTGNHDFPKSDPFPVGCFWRRIMSKLSRFFSGRFARLHLVKGPDGEKSYYKYLPPIDVEFALLLLGRSEFFHSRVTDRSPVIPATIPLQGPFLVHLSKNDRRSLSRKFAQVRDGKNINENRRAIATIVTGWCEFVDENNLA